MDLTPSVILSCGVSASMFVVSCGVAVGLCRRLMHREEMIEEEVVMPTVPEPRRVLNDRLNRELGRSWAPTRETRRDFSTPEGGVPGNDV